MEPRNEPRAAPPRDPGHQPDDEELEVLIDQAEYGDEEGLAAL